MTLGYRHGKYSKIKMKCPRDRVVGGYQYVIIPTLKRLEITTAELTMIDIGCGPARKSLGKYTSFQKIWLPRDLYTGLTEDLRAIIEDKTNGSSLSVSGIKTKNCVGIDGNSSNKKQFEEHVPDGMFFVHDFMESSILNSSVPGKFHVGLLCEVLEHLVEGPEQIQLVRDAAEFILPGGGLHVTHPAETQLETKKWGHKCKHVPRLKVMEVLEECFEEVDIAMSHGGSTVNYFATNRRDVGTQTYRELLKKHSN